MSEDNRPDGWHTDREFAVREAELPRRPSVELHTRFDEIARPAHYNRTQLECIDVITDMIAGWPSATSFNLGNALKYIWRHRDKHGLRDLKKAAWYLQREIAALERATAGKPYPTLPPAV